MKKIFLATAIAATLVMQGCSTAPMNAANPNGPTQAQVAFLGVCTSYETAISAVPMLKSAGKINQATVDQVILASHQFTPACLQKTPPANAAALTQQMTNALASGVLAEALNYSKTAATTK